ncbi:MAG: serine--tRNA ligase [Candidatus Cloacimonetes bacterium]|jgi:seryl-tRNA synthetase|nr:serine--tRNA ligase [Candidatus Cloacimonadota bacterium]MDY0325337.1 serine--tRNA ligase [Candidatus Cloacimonadaceae bacterium]
MIDIKYIRANPELIRTAIKNKNEKADLDALLVADEERRSLQYKFDNLKAQQNTVSQVIATKKRAKESVTDEIAEMGTVAAEIKTIQTELSKANAFLDALLLAIPNIPEDNVPIGRDESLNEVIRHEGVLPQYDFELKDHLDIATANSLLDLPRGAKISGSGFPIYTGYGAKLERALINFMLEYHIQKHGYTELMVPLAVNRKTMTGTGQLPKLEEDMYHINEDDLFLIPTAEVPVTNFYADEVLSYKDLPQKFVAYTPCFRREAGSYGKDTRGLQRLHQFNKVEMVRFVQPEDSQAALKEMLQDAEDILKAFGLHYRVLSLCTGDLSFASQKTYDLEVWAPGSQKYLEVSSVSNFGEFQARRANIRYKDAEGKLRHLHTLNGSGVATPRLMIALLETYQQADGSLNLPEVLKPWLELKI